MAPRRTRINRECVICGKTYLACLDGIERRQCCSRACRSQLIATGRAETFWSHVDKSGNCWVWTAARFDSGYGAFSAGANNVRAHRFAYELVYGTIPDDMLVCHHCDNPPCVRPDHLFLGSNSDNMKDMHAKGRGSGINPPRNRGEQNGSAKLTTDQVLIIRQQHADGIHIKCLAVIFGVSWQTIKAIVARKIWKHV